MDERKINKIIHSNQHKNTHPQLYNPHPSTFPHLSAALPKPPPRAVLRNRRRVPGSCERRAAQAQCGLTFAISMVIGPRGRAPAIIRRGGERGPRGSRRRRGRCQPTRMLASRAIPAFLTVLRGVALSGEAAGAGESLKLCCGRR